MAAARQYAISDAPSQRSTKGPGLPRAPSQKTSTGLPLRSYASSSSSLSTSTPPIPPGGFENGSGSVRVPYGQEPIQPREGPSSFRFQVEDETAPLTPMDLSPATPRTPGFGTLRPSPALASASSTSIHNTSSYDPYFSKKSSAPDRTGAQLYGNNYGDPSPEISDFHVEEDATQSLAPFIPGYEPPLEEEEYVRFINAEYERLRRQRSVTSAPAHSRQHSHSTSHSLQGSHGHVALPKEADKAHARSRSASSPRGNNSIEQSLSSMVISDPVPPVDLAARRRQAPAAAKTSQRSQFYDFAAAKEARERERLGVTDMQWANYPGKGQSLSSVPVQVPYPPPTQPLLPSAETAVPAVPGRPKVTPTPVKPALARLGSKLKSEVKGAFAKKHEGHKERTATPEEEVEKIGSVHWTELEP